MKIKTFIFFLILLISITSIAKNTIDQKIADFEKQLLISKGKEKIDILNKLSYQLSQRSPQKCIEYANLALKLSEEIKYKKGEVTALNNLGVGNHVRCNFQKSLDFQKKALEISKKFRLEKKIPYSLKHIGLAYRSLNNHMKALEYYLKAMDIYKKSGDFERETSTMCNIGSVYRTLGKLDKALEYYSNALERYNKIKNKNGMAASLCNIGIIYKNKKNYKKALEYYLKALDFAEEIGNTRGIGLTLGNIGILYYYLEEYNRALENLHQSIKIFRKIGHKVGISSALKKIGDINIRQKNYTKALINLENALKIAMDMKNKRLIMNCYLSLSELYKAKGDYKKAYELFKQYHEQDKNIINENSRKQMNELQEKYEAEKRGKEIEILKKENKIKEVTRNTLICGLILLLIIFIILFKKYMYFFAFWKKLKYVGQYRLIEKIGTGAMGTIFKAHSIVDKKETAALKIMKPELFIDEINKKRFKQEATIIDKLNHPNIIRIIERGEFKENLFIAMEFLEGKTLDIKINEGGPLNLDECLHIMIQITDALVLIHSKNIIHRDLKPANIMIVEKDGDKNFVKLLDFGLAKMEFQTRLTQSGNFVGTVEYVSPEQILHSQSSQLSDIFSLGVTFYYMLCGQTPFSGDNVIDIMGQILDKKPDDLSKYRPEIPKALNELVTKMINKKPEIRPQAEEVLNVLKSLRLSTGDGG